MPTVPSLNDSESKVLCLGIYAAFAHELDINESRISARVGNFERSPIPGQLGNGSRLDRGERDVSANVVSRHVIDGGVRDFLLLSVYQLLLQVAGGHWHGVEQVQRMAP